MFVAKVDSQENVTNVSSVMILTFVKNVTMEGK